MGNLGEEYVYERSEVGRLQRLRRLRDGEVAYFVFERWVPALQEKAWTIADAKMQPMLFVCAQAVDAKVYTVHQVRRTRGSVSESASTIVSDTLLATSGDDALLSPPDMFSSRSKTQDSDDPQVDIGHVLWRIVRLRRSRGEKYRLESEACVLHAAKRRQVIAVEECGEIHLNEENSACVLSARDARGSAPLTLLILAVISCEIRRSWWKRHIPRHSAARK